MIKLVLGPVFAAVWRLLLAKVQDAEKAHKAEKAKLKAAHDAEVERLKALKKVAEEKHLSETVAAIFKG